MSCPPLTYMLKFSRFASLTSCLTGREGILDIGSAVKQVISIHRMAQVAVGTQSLAYIMHNKGMLGTLACTYTPVAHKRNLISATRSHSRRHQSRHAVRYIPKAQHTFNALLIHGILQFTKVITLRCALHRCPSRGIHR